MRRLAILVIILFLIVIIIYDIKIGTIPHNTVKKPSSYPVQTIPKDTPTSTYKEVKVTNGDTILSIEEEISSGWKKHSIQKIIQDFRQLNPGVEPNAIQGGKTYRFPLYK